MKVLLCCVLLCLFHETLSLLSAKIIRLTPTGIRFEIPDEGYDFVAIHFSVNAPVVNVEAGRYNYDVHTKEDGKFVYENHDIPVHPGDTIHYWLLGLKQGVGEQRLDLSYTIPDQPPPPTSTPTPPTVPPITTKAPPPLTNPTTKAPITSGPVVSGSGSSVQGSGSQPSNNPSSTSTGTGNTPGGSDNTGTGSSSGSGDGCSSCSCTCSGNSRKTPTCKTYPCLVFEDNFDTLDLETWEHEITAGGGGNWEFEYYLNNRSNSYVRDGVLYIKPTLTTDRFGDKFLTSDTLDLWGSTPGDTCTSGMSYGCERHGTPDHINNPIQSAKLRSTRGFTFKYGKVEVEAKMPTGDWIWPAIWLLPYRNAYGQWPASGEIDIVESRGNRHYTAPDGKHLGVDTFGSTLHFGPSSLHKEYDPWQTAHVEKTLQSGTLADDFHKYGLEWTEDHIKFFFDGQEILSVSPPDQGGFWKLGHLDQTGMENPYRHAGNKMAPFDQEFYLIMNVAVGGVAYFPDENRNSPYPKPWRDASDFAPREFWNQRSQWYPTWNPDQNNGEDAAMKVNYIRVWKLAP